MINDSPIEQKKASVPFSLIWVMLFVFGAVSVSAMEGYNKIVIGLGVLAVFFFLIYTLFNDFIFPMELRVYCGFFVLVTMGMFVAKYPQVYFIAYRTVIQIFIMMIILLNYARSTRVVNLLLLTILAACMLVGFSAVWSGQYAMAEYEGERAAGFAMNANVFAVDLTFATMIGLYFFRIFKSWIIKAGIIALVLVAAKLLLASGSRKGFLGFLIIVFFWFVFCYAAEIKRKPFMFIIGLIMAIALAVLINFWMKGTIVEKRMTEDTQQTARVTMYKDGFKMIVKNPLLGVGLDHYEVYSSFQKYSHSNYIEVASNCGIIAFLLYYGIYGMLARRTLKIRAALRGTKDWEFTSIILAYILYRLILDLVYVSYYDKLNWIFFAILIGWTHSKENELKENAFYQEQYDHPDAYSQNAEIAYSQEGYSVE